VRRVESASNLSGIERNEAANASDDLLKLLGCRCARGGRTLAPIVVGLLGLFAPSLSAQAVTGRVLDGTTRRPIMLASLVLVDSLGTEYDRTMSNQSGLFQLAPGRPGAYYIVATALGYRSSMDGVLELGEGGHIPIEFYLRPDPIELEPLTATVERVQEHLTNQGFYQREKAGFGHFIAPLELEETSAMDMVDLIGRLPGVQRLGTGGGIGLFFRNLSPGQGQRPGAAPAPTGYCTPEVYVDGMRTVAPQSGSVPGARLNEFLDIQDVLAVEVYTRISATPTQYSILNTCGVILVWTK